MVEEMIFNGRSFDDFEVKQNLYFVPKARRKLNGILLQLPSLNLANAVETQQWLKSEIEAALNYLNMFTNAVLAATIPTVTADFPEDGNSDEESSERCLLTENESDSDGEESDEDEEIDVVGYSPERERHLPVFVLQQLNAPADSPVLLETISLNWPRPPLPIQFGEYNQAENEEMADFEYFDGVLARDPEFEEFELMETEDVENEEDKEYEQEMRQVEQKNINILAQWDDGLRTSLLQKISCPICQDSDNKIHFLCEECRQPLCISCEAQISKFTDADEQIKCPHCRAVQPDDEFPHIRVPRL